MRYKYMVVGDMSQRGGKREIQVHGCGRYESEGEIGVRRG